MLGHLPRVVAINIQLSSEHEWLQSPPRCGLLMASAHTYANYEHQMTPEYISKEDLWHIKIK
jgi:hypothetical protein